MTAIQVDELAKIIWDYHHMHQELKVSDCIIVLGSHDVRVAERGAELYLENWAPLVVFSGGLGRLTDGIWQKTEAETFAEIAIEFGIPAEHILIENKSTNTGENVLFTKNMLKTRGIHPKNVIVVQKPYMERRCFAAFQQNWPEVSVIATSPQISFEDYPNEDISKRDLINIMVGDLQRIKLYAEKGFQSPQIIPDQVWQAYEELVALGYNKQLIE